jgi:hypothetical protein
MNAVLALQVIDYESLNYALIDYESSNYALIDYESSNYALIDYNESKTRERVVRFQFLLRRWREQIGRLLLRRLLKTRRSKFFLEMEDAYNNNNNINNNKKNKNKNKNNHMLEAQDATDPWSLDSLDLSISSNQSSMQEDEDEDDTWSQPFCISVTREFSSASQRSRSFVLEELNRAVATDSDSDSDDGTCSEMSLRDFY